MKVISLTKNKFTFIDDEDFERVNKYKWHTNEKAKGIFYASRKPYINGKYETVALHRFITDCPKGMEIDHIDGNGLNNQKKNLRICTHTENCRNIKVRKTSKSGYKGISWDKENLKWRANIQYEGKYLNLGRFDKIEEAIEKYNNTAEKLFGSFAKLNQTT